MTAQIMLNLDCLKCINSLCNFEYLFSYTLIHFRILFIMPY